MIAGDSSTPVQANVQQQSNEEEYSSEIKEEKFQRCKSVLFVTLVILD